MIEIVIASTCPACLASHSASTLICGACSGRLRRVGGVDPTDTELLVLRLRGSEQRKGRESVVWQARQLSYMENY